MTRTDTVVASSRYVRIAVITFLAAVLPMLLTVELLAAHIGQTTREVVQASECRGDGCELSAVVVRTVTELEDRGLNCRSKPALTDTIVFEWNNDDVEVIDFAAALEASSNSAGWVRQYCLPPG
ncbi:hypothetical protein [Aeromicrobium sp.]|uniref:hypothetical protein n=1 Tax=Aeromicrobium sp. TaxID=1871063 RepID=UPI003D6A235C